MMMCSAHLVAYILYKIRLLYTRKSIQKSWRENQIMVSWGKTIHYAYIQIQYTEYKQKQYAFISHLESFVSSISLFYVVVIKQTPKNSFISF